MRWIVRASAVACVAAASLVPAPTASATVHEIVAQWCAGRAELLPPGITGGSKADNVAKPLFASGVIESITTYQDGILISFDFDHPAIKIEPTGDIVPLGPGVYVTEFRLDADFPAFQNCKKLVGP